MEKMIMIDKMSEEQVMLAEEVEEEAAEEPNVIQQIIQELNIIKQHLQGIQTTQAVFIRCLMDKGYMTQQDLSDTHGLLIQEAREQQEQEQAQKSVPPAEGIRTGTDKLPSEEVPTVSI